MFNYLNSDKKRKTPELVKSLGLFFDDGVIKCLERLGKSELKLTAKQPILLPRNSHVTV